MGNDFSDVLSAVGNSSETEVQPPKGWMAGTTLAGGMSAALCVDRAMHVLPAEMALISAQFNYLRPVAGPFELRVARIGGGGSSLGMQAEICYAGQLAVTALLMFRAERASAVRSSLLSCPHLPPPERCPVFEPVSEACSRNYDVRLADGAQSCSGAAEAYYTLWIRHRASTGRSALPALIALADAPPPPAITLCGYGAKVATMTWTANVQAPVGNDGWRIMRSRGSCNGGFSSHSSQVWDAAGRPLLSSMQGVVVFS